jgi:hypothetical protein
MKSRDFVDKIQKHTLPDDHLFGLYLLKGDFEQLEGEMFADEDPYVISDNDWEKALNNIAGEVDSIWEQLYEIVNEAIHRVQSTKEKA